MRSIEEPDPAMVIGKALAVSVVISAVMMLTTLGFMRLLSGMGLPLSAAVILVVFALSFIIAAALLDRASDDLLASFMGGASIAVSATIFIIALASGACFIIDKAELPGLDVLLTGFAMCLIASLFINRLTLRL